MSGKLTDGTTNVPNDPNLSRAYCEGRRAQIAAYPETASNPHLSGSEANAAYAAGIASYDGANPTSYTAVDVCAERGTAA